MTHSFLTDDDKKYIGHVTDHMRASMQFSILNWQPQATDLVFLLDEQMPYFVPQFVRNSFIELGDLTKLCEGNASHSMIYEAWVNDALNNIRSVARALSADDAARLIAYFKTYHGISDTAALATEAREALEEARLALYGDLSDDDFDEFD